MQALLAEGIQTLGVHADLRRSFGRRANVTQNYDILQLFLCHNPRPCPRPPSIAAVSALLARFRRQRPLRSGSLLITILGDAIAPRGGAVTLGSLITLARPFGLTERLVRTSVGRLAKELAGRAPLRPRSVYTAHGSRAHALRRGDATHLQRGAARLGRQWTL